MITGFDLTLFGLILGCFALLQNWLLTRQTDRTVKEIGERTNQMIQAEDARAKEMLQNGQLRFEELLAKIESSIAETRNMVAETRNMVVETRNMVAKMDERAQESEKERRAHQKFMEELQARIYEKIR